MKELRLCFEVKDLAKDEAGSPCPAGLQLTIELQSEIDYDKLIEDVNVPSLLSLVCLDSIVKPEDVRAITPEEYDEKYGEYVE